MVNPVEIINLARERAGRVAALNAMLLSGPVCLLTALLALALGQSSGRAWERMGVTLSLTAASRIRIGLLALAGAGLAMSAWRSWRAYGEAKNVTHLAAQIDGEINAHQEILTFAEMIASTGAGAGAARSPLFPILWRRASEYLVAFDPMRRFRLDKPRLLGRGVLLASTWITLLIGALALFSRLQRPPYYGQARRLVELANEIDKAAPDAQALARDLRAGAQALTNPNLSDKEKLARIAALQRELEHRESSKKNPEKPQAKSAHGSGAGAGQGSASRSAAGSGKENQGQGEGGKSGKGRGAGERQNAGVTKDQGLIKQARNELSEAEKQLETGSTGGQKSSTETGENNREGQHDQVHGGEAEKNALRPGNQPRQAPENKSASEPGPRAREMAGGEAKPKPGLGTKNSGTGHGDTHLGETPVPAAYARFYQPGEHGPPLGVKDARYVMVRIPETAQTGAGGKVVIGGAPSKATTPYANLPLPAGPIPANPQEQQLVPPRYRDLLR
jgi:hypothetical protein